jgi:hypothetical protein
VVSDGGAKRVILTKEINMGFGGWTMQVVRFTITEIDWLYQEADKEKCSLESLIRRRALNLEGENPSTACINISG